MCFDSLFENRSRGTARRCAECCSKGNTYNLYRQSDPNIRHSSTFRSSKTEALAGPVARKPSSESNARVSPDTEGLRLPDKQPNRRGKGKPIRICVRQSPRVCKIGNLMGVLFFFSSSRHHVLLFPETPRRLAAKEKKGWNKTFLC